MCASACQKLCFPFFQQPENYICLHLLIFTNVLHIDIIGSDNAHKRILKELHTNMIVILEFTLTFGKCIVVQKETF